MARPASTTLIVRDRESALEVLMLRRSLTASFMPGAYVFPGGAVDDQDDAGAALHRCDESEADAAQRLGIPQRALAHAVAALRECFEECGLWLGASEPPPHDALAGARRRLAAGSADFATVGAELGLHFAVQALTSWSHWVTPIDAPKRFDTRFFVAPAPPGQAPEVDTGETIALAWVRPAEALARHRDEGWPLEFATRATLESLRPHASVAGLLTHARTARSQVTIHPRGARTPAGERRVLLPHDHAYAEVMRLDPEGTGMARCSLAAGDAHRLGPKVWRVTAPNPGIMTGPGTNSYLLGGAEAVVVIDPGPAIAAHVDALLRAAPGPLRAVLVTHTHPDHSPAAAVLAARTGVPCIGLPPLPHGHQDRSFVPQHPPGQGERFEWPGLVLQALHTPGHASNHVCWWFAEESMLFTGDHVMQGSTVVIDPPDGDMAVYMASLRALTDGLPQAQWLAPGHGFLIDQPAEAVARLWAHRAAREAKVLAALRSDRTRTPERLLTLVYDDVPPDRHASAARSLLAHLLKLQAEGRARCDVTGWRAVAEASS